MNLSRIALALLLVVGLGAAYYYFDVIKAKERDDAARLAERAFGMVADDVTSLEIDKDGGILSLEKVEGSWKILKPISVDADDEAVELLIVAAEYMTIAGEVGDIESYSPKEYGLDSPFTITFGIKGGKNKGLKIGYKNPAGSDYFAIRTGGGKIILVNQGRVAAITKNLFELRNRDIFPVRTEDVTEIIVGLDRFVISAKKGNDGVWSLTEPTKARADKKGIENIVSDLAALTFSGFIDEEGRELLKYGLDDPLISFTLVYNVEKQKTTLLVGSATGGGGFYAKVKGKPTVARIPGKIMKSFPGKIDNLRDRNLIHFKMDTIEKIEIDNNGERVSLAISEAKADDENQDKKWLILKPAPGKTDADSVLGLLFDIERAKAIGFVDEKEPLGLDKPAVTVTVTTKTGVSQIKLFVTGEEKGKRYFAKVDKSDTIYEINLGTYRNLTKGYDDLRYKKVINLRSDEVGRIVVERLGQTFEVTRSDDNYNLIQPEKRKIKGDFYNRFVWTILGLKQDKVAETGDISEMGFDKPSLTISVYNAKGDFVNKITIGSRTDGGKQFYLQSEKVETIYLIKERFVTEDVINALEGLIGQ